MTTQSPESWAPSIWAQGSEPPPPCSYPLPVPAMPDPRFGPGLINAVADLLQDNGFPLINDGGDLQALSGALFAFLYRPPTTR
jgi:hypothetical protein